MLYRSYEKFAKGLQDEIAEVVADRPRTVEPSLFTGRVIAGHTVDGDTAKKLVHDMTMRGYIDYKGNLTEKYHSDKADGTLEFAEEFSEEVGINTGVKYDLVGKLVSETGLTRRTAA